MCTREGKLNRVRKGRENVGRKERSQASRLVPPFVCNPGPGWGDVWALEFWPKKYYLMTHLELSQFGWSQREQGKDKVSAPLPGLTPPATSNVGGSNPPSSAGPTRCSLPPNL